MQVLIDLHTHTTASDGQYTPAELVNISKNLGLKYLAITDHDSVDGIKEGRKCTEEKEINFISGIEISAKGNRELHILGFGIDEKNEELLQMCSDFKENRNKRKYRIIDYLAGKDIHIDLVDVEKYAKSGLVGRPHFAQVMYEKGYVSNIREAFDKYLGIPEFDKIERPKPSPESGIKIIHNAGGIAVLAHPSQLKLDNDELDKLVGNLCKCGLDGIEVYYSTHTKEQSNYYLLLAKKYNLMVTAGSDFHGENIKPEIKLGIIDEYGIIDQMIGMFNTPVSKK